MNEARKNRSDVWVVVSVIAFCGAIFAVSSFLHHIRSSSTQTMRDTDLPVTVKHAAPLIAAIERYIDENGKPPNSLDSLIPDYLSQLPDAGPVAKDGWQYSINEYAEAGGWSLWVDVRDEYSPNIFGFGDAFAFHPSGNYPECAYAGSLLPSSTGEWGYYVE